MSSSKSQDDTSCPRSSHKRRTLIRKPYFPIWERDFTKVAVFFFCQLWHASESFLSFPLSLKTLSKLGLFLYGLAFLDSQPRTLSGNQSIYQTPKLVSLFESMMMQQQPPTPPPLRRSSHSSPSSSRTPTPSYTSSSQQLVNSAYTSSLPSTYRRSSFPVSPAIHLNSSSQQIPAGLSLEMRGCRDDDDYERVTGSKAPFYSSFSLNGITSSASSSRSHSAEGASSTRNSSRTN